MVHGVSCSCCIDDIRRHIKRIVQITDIYRWIIDAYVSDFFVNQYWEGLPRSWQEFLTSLAPPAMVSLLNPAATTEGYRSVPPLSLMAFQMCVTSLSLNRKPVNLEDPSICKSLLGCFHPSCQTSEQEQTTQQKVAAIEECTAKNQSIKLEHEKIALNTPLSNYQDLNLSERIKLSNHKASLQCHNNKEETKDLNELVLQRENNPTQRGKTQNGLVNSEWVKKDSVFENADKNPDVCIKRDDSGRKMADSKTNSWDTSKTFSAATMKNGQCFALEHIFRKHVKPKKQHEIQRLSKVISMLCTHSSSSQVIDVGAGLGHLSRLLTFAYNVKVTTVEAAACHAPKAVKFDHEIKTDIKKAVLWVRHRNEEEKETENSDCLPEVSLPKHVVSTITAGMSTEDFLKLIKQNRNQQNSLPHNSFQSHTSEQSVKYGRNQLEFENECQQGVGTKILNSAKCELEMKFENLEEEKGLSETNCLDAGILLSECQKRVPEGGEMKNSFINIDHHNGNYFDGCITEQFRNSVEKCTDEKDSNHQSSDEAKDDSQDRFVLASLHACGDLTPTLLRVFVDCQAAVALASVGCCYMKLSTQSVNDDTACTDTGYPMSEFVRGVQGHQLSFAARELACHFIDCYCQRLTDNSDHLKIHGYRAAAQLIILGMKSDFKHGEMKCTVKNGAQMKFEKYAECIINKVGLGPKIPEELLNTAKSYVDMWKDVVAFYVIRLSLAPLVETLVLLDRVVYLHEQGISSTLVPIFEPRLSPRNFVLLASKS